MKCKERLEKYAREKGAPYELMTHAQRYTMQEVAAELRVPGKEVAKVTIVGAGDEMVMLVLPAPFRLNFAKVRELLGTKEVALVKEGEFAALFPDCAPGAMPPFGNLYDVPVYFDRGLTEAEHVVFRVGTHQEVMRMACADLVRLVQPTVGDFAYLA